MLGFWAAEPNLLLVNDTGWREMVERLFSTWTANIVQSLVFVPETGNDSRQQRDKS